MEFEDIPIEIDNNGTWYPLYRGNATMGPEPNPVPVGHVFIAHSTVNDLTPTAAFTVKTMFGAETFHQTDESIWAENESGFIIGFFVTPDYDKV